MASLVELSKALGPYAASEARAAWRRPRRVLAASRGEQRLARDYKPGDAAAAARTLRRRALRLP